MFDPNPAGLPAGFFIVYVAQTKKAAPEGAAFVIQSQSVG
ncbi:hypothetical protein TH47_03925 [Thalassospira sp. MCCC 1A02803]|nr:hypothetical protein TH47_03925 [Thalassospira sp. MCCC 1A02803]